jgi:hypothetical protein
MELEAAGVVVAALERAARVAFERELGEGMVDVP